MGKTNQNTSVVTDECLHFQRDAASPPKYITLIKRWLVDRKTCQAAIAVQGPCHETVYLKG